MDAAAIFTEQAVALERLAARIVGDREEARDVVADAFTALLAGGPTDEHHAVPWLFVTVRNRAYNRVRRQALAQRRLPVLAAGIDAAVEPESVVRRDPFLRTLLSTATARLTARDRIAVSMRHVDQASYEDIAAALGTTVTQARVVVHRANTKLRRSVISSIARRRDIACNGRGAVSEELAVLLQAPVVIPPSRFTRVEDAVRRWWSRTRIGSGRVATQVGELLVPGAALMAVVSGSTDAVMRVPSSPALPSVAAAPAPAVERYDATTASTSTILPATLLAAPDVSTGLPPTKGTIGSPVRFDDPGSSPTSQHRSRLWTLLGLPLVVFDALDLPAAPSGDIRSLEFATLADLQGNPRALRWRIDLAAAPDAASGLELQWTYEGTDCTTVFLWPMSWDSSVLTRCPVVPTSVTRLGLPPVETSDSDSPVEFHIDGTVLEVTLPFRSLDERTRTFLYPGVRMVRIVAFTTCPGIEDCPGDRAPDDGSYTYQVER